MLSIYSILVFGHAASSFSTKIHALICSFCTNAAFSAICHDPRRCCPVCVPGCAPTVCTTCTASVRSGAFWRDSRTAANDLLHLAALRPFCASESVTSHVVTVSHSAPQPTQPRQPQPHSVGTASQLRPPLARITPGSWVRSGRAIGFAYG